MKDFHIDRLDLRLLRLFEALWEEQSVTRAAERLSVTQSAVSHGLSQLRQVLGDELFVRGSKGMQPTPRANQIGPRLRQGLAQLQLALSPDRFIPEKTDREFAVACSSTTSILLFPHVVRRLRAEAPRSRLSVRSNDGDVVGALDAQRIDFAAGVFKDIPERLPHTELMEERFVWVLSAKHPLANSRLTIKRLADLQHVVVANSTVQRDATDGWIVASGIKRRLARDDAGAFEAALAAKGLRRNVVLTVPDAQSALAYVGSSDMVAQLPRRLALHFSERYRLKIFEAPYSSPDTSVVLMWHKVYGEDPAVVWLRKLMLEEAAKL